MAGEAADVHLVDDRARGRPAQRRVAFPVVGGGIDDHALHRRRGVVARLPRGLAACSSSGTTTPRPYGSSSTFAGSKRKPAAGSDGPVHAVAVELPRLARPARRRASSGRSGSRPGRAGSRATGFASSSRSKSSSSTPVAVREKRLKLTPSSTTVAPSGALCPALLSMCHGWTSPSAVGLQPSGLGELDDDLDVVRLSLRARA